MLKNTHKQGWICGSHPPFLGHFYLHLKTTQKYSSGAWPFSPEKSPVQGIPVPPSLAIVPLKWTVSPVLKGY